MKENAVYARAQAVILRSSGHSVKDIAKLLKQTERWVNKWSKRKSFEDKPRSGRPSVLTNRARNVVEKAKYKHNNSTRKIAKKTSTSQYQRFEHKGFAVYDRQRVESFQAKKDTTSK